MMWRLVREMYEKMGCEKGSKAGENGWRHLKGEDVSSIDIGKIEDGVDVSPTCPWSPYGANIQATISMGITLL